MSEPCDHCKWCKSLGCNEHEAVTGPARAAAPSVEPDLMLHTQEADANGVWCREDGQRWPCDIARAAAPPVELRPDTYNMYEDFPQPSPRVLPERTTQ